MYIITEDLVLSVQKTHCLNYKYLSIMYSEVISLYYENYRKNIHPICRKMQSHFHCHPTKSFGSFSPFFGGEGVNLRYHSSELNIPPPPRSCGPARAMASLILEVSRLHTTTHHSRWDPSGRVISSSQRLLPGNTQHSQQTSIHPAVEIRTHNSSRRAAADLPPSPPQEIFLLLISVRG